MGCSPWGHEESDASERRGILWRWRGPSDSAGSGATDEATIMGQFNHPHILHLEGVVTKSMRGGVQEGCRGRGRG